MVNKDLHSS